MIGETRSPGREAARMALGGAVASMAMTGMRQLTTELGIVHEVPPREMTRSKFPRLFRRAPRKGRKIAVELFHWTYGALAAASFRVLPGRVRRNFWSGPLFGFAMWAVFEGVLSPALKLDRRKRRPAKERVAVLADHLLYGLVVGSAARAREA